MKGCSKVLLSGVGIITGDLNGLAKLWNITSSQDQARSSKIKQDQTRSSKIKQDQARSSKIKQDQGFWTWLFWWKNNFLFSYSAREICWIWRRLGGWTVKGARERLRIGLQFSKVPVSWRFSHFFARRIQLGCFLRDIGAYQTWTARRIFAGACENCTRIFVIFRSKWKRIYLFSEIPFEVSDAVKRRWNLFAFGYCQLDPRLHITCEKEWSQGFWFWGI